MPTHHRVAWLSPKITLPRTAWTQTNRHDISLADSLCCKVHFFSDSVVFYVNILKVKTDRGVQRELTEEMKLDAVVVTVALAEEEQCRRALEKKVHIMALQVKSRTPHSSLRGMWS